MPGAVSQLSIVLEVFRPADIMVKLDFNNVINCLHHPDMLRAVADRLQIFALLTHIAYRQFFFTPHLISSQVDPQ